MTLPTPRLPASPRPHRWLLGAGALLLAWVLLRPQGMAVEVSAMPWRRDIEIERHVLEMHSDWCAQMPADAQLLDRQLRSDPSNANTVAEHCRYRAAVWRVRDRVVAQGEHPQAPHWPSLAPQLGTREGTREGKRMGWQELQLRDGDGRLWSCRLPLPAWQRWARGDRTRLAVHRFSGVADCSSLPAAPR